MKKTGIRLSYSLPDNELIVYSDPLRIKQVISNLINNAIKFTAYGTVTFSCHKENNDLIFSVSDTGTGIPEADQKQIFERFKKYNYQGMNTEGTGIGLAIAEKIIESLNGRIWLTSKVGEGTSFFFSIPYKASFLSAPPVKKNEKAVVAVNQDVKVRSILVVEDEPDSSFLIRELLRPFNFVIEFVSNGQDAVNFVRLNPDTMMVLMDIQLPAMNGYEATSEIRKFNLKIPIIAQTAYAMLGDREKALLAGCNDYITKPLDINKFREIVKVYSSN